MATLRKAPRKAPHVLAVSELGGELYLDFTGIALPSRSNNGRIGVEVF